MPSLHRILVDIRNRRVLLRREIYSLLQHFQHNDIELYLQQSDYNKLHSYGTLVKELNNLHVVTDIPFPTSELILLTDRMRVRRHWRKVIRVRYDVFFNSSTNESNTLNFSEHPILTAAYDRGAILQLRGSVKDIGVLFAVGTIDPTLYSSPILMRAFGVMNRYDLFEAIMHYPGAVVVDSEFYSANQHHHLVILTEKIPQKSWLEILASSKFYITTSGVVMPMCHNIIEAMSVGTIPVTQYPHLFWPPLTHLRNCIAFTDEHDLTHKIDALLSMNSDQCAQMRDEVLAYYDTFLRPGANTKRILHLLQSPHHTEELFCIAGSASLRALGWRTPLRWRIDLTIHSVRRRIRSYLKNSSASDR